MSMQHFLSWNQEDHEGFDTEIIGSKRRPRWTGSPGSEPVVPATAMSAGHRAESVSAAAPEPIPPGRALTPKAEEARPVQFRNHLAHTPKLSF